MVATELLEEKLLWQLLKCRVLALVQGSSSL